MAKSSKKKPKKLARKTDAKLIRKLFPKEVLDEVHSQLKDAELKRDK